MKPIVILKTESEHLELTQENLETLKRIFEKMQRREKYINEPSWLDIQTTGTIHKTGMITLKMTKMFLDVNENPSKLVLYFKDSNSDVKKYARYYFKYVYEPE